MVQVVFFVGLRRLRARVGTGGVESDDRGITRELVSPSLGETANWIGVVQRNGITRELVSPSLGETESWIGVVQFVQSQLRDVGLSDSYTYSLLYARSITRTRRSDARGGAQGRSAGRTRATPGRSVERTKAKTRQVLRGVLCLLAALLI